MRTARSRDSSIRPCVNRTHASKPRAHETPPQSLRSVKVAAEVSSRASATSYSPWMKESQARFWSAQASPRRSSQTRNSDNASSMSTAALSVLPRNNAVIPENRNASASPA